MGPYSLEYNAWVWDFPGLSALDITYSPDAQYFAAAGGTYESLYGPRPPVFSSLTIYDARSGAARVSIPETYANGGGFTAVVFSPDGRHIAADSGYNITIWEFDRLLNEDQTPVATLKPPETIGDLVFSPDGTKLVAGQALLRTGGDGFASLVGPCAVVAWNVSEALERARTGENGIEINDCYPFSQTFGPGRFVTYSPSGDMILVYGSDMGWQGWTTPMTLLDSATGDVLRHFWTESSFAIAPDSTFMISEGIDKRLHYWGVPAAEE